MGGKRIGKWLIISTKGLERRFPSLSLVWVAELQYLCSVKTKNGMKRKTVGIIVAMLVLALAGGIGWNWRDMPQKRLLRAAENRVFIDADSAARLLAQVDTTRLSEDSRMLFDLMRALVNEERWCLSHADTASCLWADTVTWSFNREVAKEDADDHAAPDDSTLLRVYRYYEDASLGGTVDDRDVLRRFGSICFVLSRYYREKVQLTQANRVFHLAIHCAEATGDHALAYRAYSKFVVQMNHTSAVQSQMFLRRALEHYRQSPDQPRRLLTLLNDYGFAVLHCAPFDLHHFGSLTRITALAARHRNEPPSPAVNDSVYQCLDTLWALPHADFSYTCTMRINKVSTAGEISVPVGMYEESQQEHKADETKHSSTSYESDRERAEQDFAVNRDTYLAPGYVRKSAVLQRRLMTTAIIILVLAVVVLLLVFRNWRVGVRRRHDAEQAAHRREAEQLAERLRQKDSMIAMLRGHILDKSEILDMLEPTKGKRTVINARNWREIEATLDTADGGFVSRLRSEHPEFSEDDIRLCMLARLKLSNTALSAIYVISVSAVQHRKQKLKKDGFGVSDPAVTLDQIIANI